MNESDRSDRDDPVVFDLCVCRSIVAFCTAVVLDVFMASEHLFHT